MSYLPKLYNSLATARENISFNGLSKLPEISAGELKAAVNMDNSILPALRARGAAIWNRSLSFSPATAKTQSAPGIIYFQQMGYLLEHI